jgi:hypothetical protein
MLPTESGEHFFETIRNIWANKVERRSDRNEENDENIHYDPRLEVQKVFFLMHNAVGWSSKMCFPLRAGSTFCKQDEKISHVAKQLTKKNELADVARVWGALVRSRAAEREQDGPMERKNNGIERTKER